MTALFMGFIASRWCRSLCLGACLAHSSFGAKHLSHGSPSIGGDDAFGEYG